MNSELITCPVCGNSIWELYRYKWNNGEYGIRVKCCTPNCQVDNVTQDNSNVKMIWTLIEAENL